MKILAIDLGGMSAKIGLIEDKVILKRWTIKTDVDDLWGNIKNNLTDITLNDFDVVGISLPGFIDHDKGVVTLAGNLNLKNYDVKSNFSKHFPNKPTFVVNDANAATLGEFWVGAGGKYESMLLYTIGTGVGGGVVLNGKLIYGKNGYAGEFGHGGQFQDKWPCTCGLKGCVEPVSSATGIEKELTNHFGTKTTILDVSKKFISGDSEITKIFEGALRPLAKHIATMLTALNPEAVIIGGGPSALGEPLRKLIEQLVHEYSLDFVAESVEVLLAETKNDAGMLGAAYWALTMNK